MSTDTRLHFTISTPYGDTYAGLIDYLMCTSAEGDIGLRPNHENTLLRVRPGDLKIIDGREETLFVSDGGTLYFENNTAVLVTNFAALAHEYVQKRQEYTDHLEQRYSNELKSEAELERMRMALHRSLVQTK